MKFWIHLGFYQPALERPYMDLVDETVVLAQAAERLGFEGVVIPEDNFSNSIVSPSALQMISYVAPQTSRIKFLTGILVLPYHHPLLLAGQIAAADHLTRGRLSVGVARGAGPRTAARLGIPPENMRGMYEESLAILKRAWTEYDITHQGEFWQFDETTVLPRTYRDGVPELWIAAMSAEGLRNAGKHGSNLMTGSNAPTFFSPYDELEQAVAHYDAGLAETGAERGNVMVTRWCWVDKTEEAAFRRLPQMYAHWRNYAAGAPPAAHKTSEQLFLPRDNKDSGWERRERPIVNGRVIVDGVPEHLDLDAIEDKRDGALILDVEKAIATFKHFEEVGVTDINLVMQWGAPVEEIVRSMELISTEVMPAFTVDGGSSTPRPAGDHPEEPVLAEAK